MADVAEAAQLPPALDASQERALNLFRAGRSVALLGRAGSGESEVMRRMVKEARERYGDEGVAIGALSGAAALIIGGQTLHSLFGMDIRPLSRDAWVDELKKRPQVCMRLNSVRVLFIDEVCTVPSSLLDKLSYVMRRLQAPFLQGRPFGGCQVVGTFALLASSTTDSMLHCSSRFYSASVV